ncbi:FG-GAP repeat domain-containing protein [Rhizohabitans arisaemae]|uniref:FG-GAP repeat domain-containing protein n=1 Tax=Rhizohabitans arisaemae TaxID=2720610 RepID=UPI0024B14661|nr:VCBS repeat-containing protein [Rhizohabitans arisaemae]
MVAIVLLLGGCGTEPGRDAPTSSSSTPASAPAAGKGGDNPDDINGDGFADLVFSNRNQETPPDLTIVYGSKDGLNPQTRTVVTTADFGFDHVSNAGTADMDSDGFADVLIYGFPVGAYRGVLHLLWGGPKGVDPDARPTVIQPPFLEPNSSYAGVPGDFDGDGNGDLAMGVPRKGTSEEDLAVLYGPFTREGAPRRHTTQPGPGDWPFSHLVAGRIDGRHATSLLVHSGTDGGQMPSWLFEGGPDGLSRDARELNAGNSSAFGDFDGDGADDVVVADDGNRNGEPGYETEPPQVEGVMTVYFGGAGRAPQVFKNIRFAQSMVAGDYDGDGQDDLAIDRGSDGVELFHGEATGLRRDGKVIRRLGPYRDLTPEQRTQTPFDDPEELLDILNKTRPAGPWAAADYDGDGRDELALAWFAPDLPAWEGSVRSLWWITDGSRDESTFDTDGW